MISGSIHRYRRYGHNKCSKCNIKSCELFRGDTTNYLVCSSCDLLFRDAAAVYIKQEALVYLCNYYVLLKKVLSKFLIYDAYNYIFMLTISDT